ncbi:protein RFT1 homolog [Pomacea canaliculata]|uniref:protein RFT1 homolog n=1 Tax=Pomacea canaliculata TaxID=400727 RepID=UPI000D72A642|nr:protein RFT1 homolog [Pomacea canaliculata]
MKASAILASATKAATYNMVLQLAMRVMTFMLNAVVLRYISRDLLGVVNVRLTLLYSTILFLTKEAFDRACLSRAEKRDWRLVTNLMWCTSPLALTWSILLTIVWLYFLETPDPHLIPHYTLGVIMFAVSSCIEVLAEPLFVTGQAFMFIRLKVVILGLSQAIRCFIAVILVLVLPHWGLLGFAMAQLSCSICYAAMYYLYFAHYVTSQVKKDDGDMFPFQAVQDFFPQAVEGKPLIDSDLASLTWSFFKQSFLKQLLTEGERYIMTFLDVLSFADQGVYDVINNLGSMVARFVFLPIEENGYLFFSQMLVRGKLAHEQTEESIVMSSRVLGVLMKIVTLIGCIILVFGYSNAYLALSIYGGENLSSGSGPTLLRWYCLYVLVIAINGTTEGFVFATMSKKDVDRYNKKMLVFSVMFLTMAWYLTKQIGSVGFIIANCLNMMARISHSIWFIQHYFAGSQFSPLSNMWPSIPVIVTMIISLLLTSVSENYCCYTDGYLGKLSHVGLSGVCLLVVAASVFLTEHAMVKLVTDQIFKRKHSKES